MASSKNLIIVICASVILTDQIEPSVFRRRCYGDGEKLAVLRTEKLNIEKIARWADDPWDYENFLQQRKKEHDAAQNTLCNMISEWIAGTVSQLKQLGSIAPVELERPLTPRRVKMLPVPEYINLSNEDNLVNEEITRRFATGALRKNLCKILAFMQQRNLLFVTFPYDCTILNNDHEMIPLFAQEKILLENNIHQVDVLFTDTTKLTLCYSQKLQQWSCDLSDRR